MILDILFHEKYEVKCYLCLQPKIRGGVMRYVSLIFCVVVVLFSLEETQAKANHTAETSMVTVQSSPKQKSAGALVSDDTRITIPIPGPPLVPINLCLGGTVIDEGGQRGDASADPVGLAKAIDGDLGTFVLKKGEPPGWLEVPFGWHPRWINKINIAVGGAGPYQVEYKDLEDAWHVVGTHSETHSLGTVVHYETFDFEPVKAKAIRWRSSEDTPIECEGYEVYEIEAYFLQVDLDDDEQWEIGVEWVNDYPEAAGLRDLSNRDLDALSLYNRVDAQPGWTGVFELGNAEAWERDFKRAFLGGNENIVIDQVDLALFTGHGTFGRDVWDPTWESRRRALCFGVEEDDLYLVPGEGGRWSDGTHSWGDVDLEWLALVTCQTMRDHRYWANGMNGLHLILGWKTDSQDWPFFGASWAIHLIAGRTVTQAWFSAADGIYDPRDGPWIAGVIGEERDNLNDHLWGVGDVSPDPEPDAWYHYWTHEAAKEKEETKGELLSEWLNDSTDLLVLLPHPNGKGKPVKYKSSVPSSVQESTMVQYYVIPRSVDSAYIRNIAYNMCAVESVMCCTTQVESDGEGHLWIVCGSEELRVSEASGGVEYVNSAWWMIPPTVAPALPDPSWAGNLADAFLTEMMMKPPDSYVWLVSLAYLGWFNKVTGKADQDSSMYTSIMVSYRREMTSGYQVLGAGAVLNVTYGDNDRLERWAMGGWRDVYPGPEVSVITVEEAMELVATEGSDATIGGIPLCDTVLVIDAELAYYEENGDVVQDELEIIWALTCLCISEYDTGQVEIYVPARALPPRGSIDAPPDGSWYPEGEAVVFSGSATGGLTPYSFDWYSDVDGYLGSGEIITINTLSAIVRDGTVIPHTITLTVTDLNGMSDNARISVFIGFMRGDANGDWMVDTGDVIYLINYLFTGTSAPDPLWVGDCNCDDIVDTGDVIYLINYLFTGTSPPGCP
jgi:hypothetical protein